MIKPRRKHIGGIHIVGHMGAQETVGTLVKLAAILNPTMRRLELLQRGKRVAIAGVNEG